ncbi:hypothetical protein QYE76_020792 [Lolium multiflorum]|uniref:Knottins-like domain-containing protein n=1 Tax=Lolium multiflorum TaxID=4521 RepID=A0AAD8VS89_LOLMU|nr:hypothetical protein QYE76_020792 [Lolium multiflorum]
MGHYKIAVTALCFFLLVTMGFGKKHTPCEGPSKTFKGDLCEDTACNAACISEDYKAGFCKVVRDVGCLCTNNCHDSKPSISLN